MELAPCPSCRRHVATDAVACPFCAASAPARPHVPTLVGRMSRAAVFSALAGCHPSPPVQSPPPPPATSDAGVATVVDAPPDAAATTIDAGPAAAGTAQLRIVVTLSSTRQRYPTRVTVITLPWKTGSEPREERTDGNGELVLSLAPGEYRLQIEQPQSNRPHDNEAEPVERTVKLVEGARETLDVVVKPYPHIERGPGPMPYGAPPARRRVV